MWNKLSDYCILYPNPLKPGDLTNQLISRTVLFCTLGKEKPNDDLSGCKGFYTHAVAFTVCWEVLRLLRPVWLWVIYFFTKSSHSRRERLNYFLQYFSSDSKLTFSYEHFVQQQSDLQVSPKPRLTWGTYFYSTFLRKNIPLSPHFCSPCSLSLSLASRSMSLFLPCLRH